MGDSKKRDCSAYLFIAPAGIIYLSVIVVPVFYSFFISLFKWNGIGKKSLSDFSITYIYFNQIRSF